MTFLRLALIFGCICLADLSRSRAKEPTATEDHAEHPDATAVLPNGQVISPLAASEVSKAQTDLQELNPRLTDSPDFVANGGILAASSPDHKTLVVLTSGYNSLPGASSKTQFIFVYAINSAGYPAFKQALQIPNSFGGLVFNPSGKAFYVSGGKDDVVHTFIRGPDGLWGEPDPGIKLHHSAGNGIDTGPVAAALAITPDGRELVVTNLANDSISVIDLYQRAAVNELDLRPGKLDPNAAGQPGGEYPIWVTISSKLVAYVSSLRDREIVAIQLGDKPKVIGRVAIDGNPGRLVLDPAENYLYGVADNSDRLFVIDLSTLQVVASVQTMAAQRMLNTDYASYKGASPNSLAVGENGTVYVTNGGTNCVSIIEGLPLHPTVTGLIPTGYYPSSVVFGDDKKHLYIVNAKGITGPNNGFVLNKDKGQYVLSLQWSSLLTIPLPSQDGLVELTRRTIENNLSVNAPSEQDAALFRELHHRIRHIIYVIKENRTYDQVLGDLDRGNGDPKLVEFGSAVTPSEHQLSKQFVCLDNFQTSGDVSADGWPWSTAGRELDIGVKSVPLQYAGEGTTYDYEGTNRGINVGLPTAAERRKIIPETPDDVDILPGTADVAAPDDTNGHSGEGYLWDASRRADVSTRNYGFFVTAPKNLPLEVQPSIQKLVVAYPTKKHLLKNTDPYFRGFDSAFPDFWREAEWEREFTQFVDRHAMPRLNLVRLPADHTGAFKQAIDRVNTPELQVADNDYALGRLVEQVAATGFKNDTLIIAVEDDSQSGADHVDAHRSIVFFAGPFVKQGKVVSEFYTTVNLVRTIEDILGLHHLNIHTATARPMSDVFDLDVHDWTFRAEASSLLKGTDLPIPVGAFTTVQKTKPTHDARYWARVTAGFDFSDADRLDAEAYNRVLWQGLKGPRPYPTTRSGEDLRLNRSTLLRAAGVE
ncbi:MAG: phosphoesterase [Verrucomicrobia bacterium]|nr:phosphoesterase [Verrucomicrobiota bacterium]